MGWCRCHLATFSDCRTLTVAYAYLLQGHTIPSLFVYGHTATGKSVCLHNVLIQQQVSDGFNTCTIQVIYKFNIVQIPCYDVKQQ